MACSHWEAIRWGKTNPKTTTTRPNNKTSERASGLPPLLRMRRPNQPNRHFHRTRKCKFRPNFSLRMSWRKHFAALGQPTMAFPSSNPLEGDDARACRRQSYPDSTWVGYPIHKQTDDGRHWQAHGKSTKQTLSISSSRGIHQHQGSWSSRMSSRKHPRAPLPLAFCLLLSIMRDETTFDEASANTSLRRRGGFHASNNAIHPCWSLRVDNPSLYCFGLQSRFDSNKKHPSTPGLSSPRARE